MQIEKNWLYFTTQNLNSNTFNFSVVFTSKTSKKGSALANQNYPRRGWIESPPLPQSKLRVKNTPSKVKG